MIINIHGVDFETETRIKHFSDCCNSVWEPETFEVIKRFACPGKVFIDVGAWIGIFSIYANGLGCYVHALEPDPIAFKELTENIKINRRRLGIKTHEEAIGEENGQASLWSRTYDGMGNSESSLLERDLQMSAEIVDVLKLNAFIVRENIVPSLICLIKVDIEGGEIMLLKGACPFIGMHKPPMYISFHPGWFEQKENDIQACIDILFPHYHAVSIEDDWRYYDAVNFAAALASTGNHNFLFLPKI